MNLLTMNVSDSLGKTGTTRTIRRDADIVAQPVTRLRQRVAKRATWESNVKDETTRERAASPILLRRLGSFHKVEIAIAISVALRI
jgi:hypothetical protein